MSGHHGNCAAGRGACEDLSQYLADATRQSDNLWMTFDCHIESLRRARLIQNLI